MFKADYIEIENDRLKLGLCMEFLKELTFKERTHIQGTLFSVYGGRLGLPLVRNQLQHWEEKLSIGTQLTGFTNRNFQILILLRHCT